MPAPFGRFASRGLICAIALLASLSCARAEGFQVVYTFCTEYSCPIGDHPASGLITDAQGDLYGTTPNGGSGAYCEAGNCGVVYRLTPDGTGTALYSFCAQQGCADGQLPTGNLVMDAAGNIYGSTLVGGNGADCPPQLAECGTVFKLAPDGTETVLHDFCSQAGCADGAVPNGGLVLDGQGNLYGTTENGGTGQCEGNNYLTDCGVVFKLAPDGTETVLYQFCSRKSCADGSSPLAGLVRDGKGNLYGTTVNGGSGGVGVVFELKPGGNEVVRHSFGGGGDGAYPVAGLLADGKGNFWGTTEEGGAHKGGTVFQLTARGSETVLYSFCSKRHCRDGGAPTAALVADAAGNLYGTTVGGGGGKDVGDCNGCGVVFKVSPGGTETTLHGFCRTSCADGAVPEAGLLATGKGELFGTTENGGAADIGGTVFRLKE
jgi:uncharacterized repeat protein (TIGR03803 family)